MRLYIHDDEERHGEHDADDGISGAIRATDTVRLRIKQLAELHSALAQLVKEKKTFRRVLWMTHGSPGKLWFGHDALTSAVLDGNDFTAKGYQNLFPEPTKMYFSGCNVAGDSDCNGACNPATLDIGWKFLESAGELFLHAGGYTMGWTSTGYGLNSTILRNIISSHSMHFSGDVRTVTFGAKGKVLERLSYDGGVLSGDMFDRLKVYVKLENLVPNDV